VLTVTVRLLRTASIVICLIVIGSFLVFAVNQTKSASAAQQEELTGAPAKPASASGAPATTGGAPTAPAKPQPPAMHESGLHEALDNTSNALTSPFAGIVSSSDSEWATRGVRMFLALLVYGFGLGYLARMLRVRV
jgi:hypothetical protein